MSESIPELLKLLNNARELLSCYTGGISRNFNSAEDFLTCLTSSIERIENGNYEDLPQLYYWFAPTCDWDDIVGMEGMEIGNRVSELLSKIVEI